MVEWWGLLGAAGIISVGIDERIFRHGADHGVLIGHLGLIVISALALGLLAERGVRRALGATQDPA